MHCILGQERGPNLKCLFLQIPAASQGIHCCCCFFQCLFENKTVPFQSDRHITCVPREEDWLHHLGCYGYGSGRNDDRLTHVPGALQGTFIWINYPAMQTSEAFWENATEFQPERFWVKGAEVAELDTFSSERCAPPPPPYCWLHRSDVITFAGNFINFCSKHCIIFNVCPCKRSGHDVLFLPKT